MSKIGEARSTFGKLTTTQATVDLPASSGTPAKITVTGEMVVQLTVYVAADFFWTLADTDATAATRLGADTTRCKWPAGLYSFPVVGVGGHNFYLKSQVDAATVDGIAYALVEAD